MPACRAESSFHPSGRLLATGGRDKLVRLWDITDPTAPQALGDLLPERPAVVYAVASSPDGNTLAAGGGEGATFLYDVTHPESPTQLGDPLGLPHGGAILGLAFSPSAPLLATAGADGQVWLWDVTDVHAPRTRGGRPALENDPPRPRPG